METTNKNVKRCSHDKFVLFGKDVSHLKYTKKEFKALPTRWFVSDDGNLTIMFKIGILKDGKNFLGFLAFKNNGKLTHGEEAALCKRMNEVVRLVVENMGGTVVSSPPPDWMVPKKILALIEKKTKEKETINYIG